VPGQGERPLRAGGNRGEPLQARFADGVTATELASEVGLARSTVYRLLLSLSGPAGFGTDDHGEYAFRRPCFGADSEHGVHGTAVETANQDKTLTSPEWGRLRSAPWDGLYSDTED